MRRAVFWRLDVAFGSVFHALDERAPNLDAHGVYGSGMPQTGHEAHLTTVSRVDLAGAVLWRVVRPLDRGLMARLWWARERRSGDRALEVVEGVVRRGDVVLDIGANLGLFAYRLAQLVGPDGEVHAFEPHPGQRENLVKIESTRRNVQFHAVALSAQPGTAEMAVPRVEGRPDLALATLEQRPGETDRVEVRVETLDRMLGERRRPVAFVKCDVEGNERAVLEGAVELLEKDSPTLLIEIEQRHQSDDIRTTFRLLDEIGYDGYAVRRDGLAPVTQFDPERDQLRFVRAAPDATEMPPDYVNDFLFVSRRRSRDLPLPLVRAASAGASG
jgi:FkbM family methyltransferase